MIALSLGEGLGALDGYTHCPIETNTGSAILEEAVQPPYERHWDSLVRHCQEKALLPHSIICLAEVQ